ncbi:hypothetical protein BEV10_07900 [Lactobacillus crispatus]|nr:hypothetical protein BEV10_07900 [Lactobacillus crispatus]
MTSVDVFVVINILSNRSKWTFYFLQSVQVNFTIGEEIFFQKNNYLNYHPSTNPAQLPQAAVNHLPQVLAPLMTRSKK